MKPFTTIIFDIGNVIIDIDYNATVAEFKKIAVVDFSSIVSYHHQQNFFDQYEKGEITTAEFRAALRPYLRADVTDAQIDHAWNAIFTAFPVAKFEMLLKLKAKYRTCALSNINEMHIAYIDAYLQKEYGKDLSEYFHHAYYSHELGCRKPEPAIYEKVLEQEGLNPAEILFIDDKAENIEAAAKFGIQTIHLTDREQLLKHLYPYI